MSSFVPRSITAVVGFALLFQASAMAATTSFTFNSVRVQVLSPTLVRIEAKGPKGFEDRPSLRILKRDWPSVAATVSVSGTNSVVTTADWTLTIPTQASSLASIVIRSTAGTTLWRYATLPSSTFSFPEPTAAAQAFAVGDVPRLIPGPSGYSPAPAGSDNAASNGWELANNAIDVYVFLPKGDPMKLRSEFNELTGRTGMIPLKALGAWDSRWYEYTEETALQQIEDYRSRDFPLDMLAIDTDWRVGGSTGYEVNTDDFPDIARFFQRAHAANVQVMFNDHPLSVSTPLSPQEVAFRNNALRGLFAAGLDIWWFDQNWTQTLAFPTGFNKTNWGTYVYNSITEGYYGQRRPMAMSNIEGLSSDILVHRYPIQWTGDIYTGEFPLEQEIRTAVNMGVYAGYPYTSSDIGGHIDEPTPENYVRWIQFGALSPILRPHCTRPMSRMPWVYGDEAEEISRKYYKLRYRLIPLLYRLAHENYETAMPMLRRCDLVYPAFPEAADATQYLLGNDVLVAPVSTTRVTVPPSWLKTPDGVPGLKGEYFSNTSLSGDPTLTRTDANIDFNWGNASPGGRVPQDNFSVRWTGTITVGADDAMLAIRSDDGVRLTIDDNVVIDNWGPSNSLVVDASVVLTAGTTHTIKLEYLEQTGGALCRLAYTDMDAAPNAIARSVWIPPGTWIDTWTGERILGPKSVTVVAPLERMPLYVREGTILPLAPEMLHVTEKPWDITVDVYPSEAGVTKASLYEDDGVTNDYQAGVFRTTPFKSSTNSRGEVEVHVGAAEGSFNNASTARTWKVRIHSPSDAAPAYATVDGQQVSFQLLPKDEAAMPFANEGGSPDGAVVEVAIPSSSVSLEHTVVVGFGPLSGLEISEIMYSPAAPTAEESGLGFGAGDFEYIELHNAGAATLDLSGVKLTGAVHFVFPSGTTLAPGAYLLVVKNSAAFVKRYGSGLPLAGQWSAGESLPDVGAEIGVESGAGDEIVSITYSNQAPWPVESGTQGYALVLDGNDSSQASNWRVSRAPGGSPGRSDSINFAIWAQENTATAQAGADDDHDGNSNEIEYLLGGDPHVADSLVTTQVANLGGTDYLTISFRRQIGATDADWLPEVSGDLTTWAESAVRINSTPQGDGTALELWRAPEPVGSRNSAFLRVHAGLQQ